jgi:hypothetical protein
MVRHMPDSLESAGSSIAVSDTSPAEYRPSSGRKLVGIDPQVILDRIAAGALQREIAAELGVERPAISWYIAKHVDPARWATVKRESIQSRLEQSARDMDAAGDALTLARARESARLWMWRAEREHPDVWGAKQQVDMRVATVDLSDRLRSARSRIVGQNEGRQPADDQDT